MNATLQSQREAPHAEMPATERGAPASEHTADERIVLIAQAAYLRAEKRGFTPGSELDDWLAAEVEVDQRLKSGQAGAAAS